MRRTTALWVMLMFAFATVTASTAFAQGNPCNPCGGKAKNPCNPCGDKAAIKVKVPAVNPCHAKMGTVFHINDPMSRNTVTFKSEAPLEDIVGTSNQIVGYIVFNPKKPKDGLVGEINVPAASLTTGIPLRDEHLQQTEWLDASAHPMISMVFDKASGVKTVKSSDEFTTYEMDVSGRLTIRGKTKNVSIPIKVTFLTESEKTQAKMPGDLLACRATFDVKLKDFGVKGFDGVVGSKVGDTISVSVSVIGTNKLKSAMNPCNPCGGKGKNPCNPCGGKKG